MIACMQRIIQYKEFDGIRDGKSPILLGCNCVDGQKIGNWSLFKWEYPREKLKALLS